MKIYRSDILLVSVVLIIGLTISLVVAVLYSNRYRIERDEAREELRAVLHLNPDMLPICHWSLMMDKSASEQLINSGFIAIYPREFPDVGE